MGMDVYGKSATTEAGKYFRNNVWWWRPLADYCQDIAPAITSKCRYWHSNDGDGLNAADSKALADKLEVELTSGRTAAYAAIREAEQNAIPDERCQWCEGTGVRRDAVGEAHAMPDRLIEDEGHPRRGESGWCNGCDGKGFIRPSATWYPFSVENVQKFVTFLRECGGFEIC